MSHPVKAKKNIARREISGVLGEVNNGGRNSSSGISVRSADYLPAPILDASFIQHCSGNVAPVSPLSPSSVCRASHNNGSMVSHRCCAKNVCASCAILPIKNMPQRKKQLCYILYELRRSERITRLVSTYTYPNECLFLESWMCPCQTKCQLVASNFLWRRCVPPRPKMLQHTQTGSGYHPPP